MPRFRSSFRLPRRLAAAGSIASLALVVAACGSSSSSSSGSSSTATNAAQVTTPVSIALDWTPNTNHTGIFVAQKLGYYKAAGIDAKIVPYGNTPVETLLGSGKVQFGVSYEDGLTLAKAAGQKLTSVYTILEKPDLVIGVRANRGDIATPKQLDGKTYAGFGVPFEKPFLQTVIHNAGGTGNFKSVSLSTSAYDAVYNGRADFALPEPSWEVIQARLDGKPFKTFDPYAYGAPPPYSEILAASDAVIAQNPGLVKRFVAATAKGYQYAVDHPAAAAKLLLDANPQVLKNPQLVDQSQALESKEYYLDKSGKLGTGDLARWTAYTEFLAKNHILKDASGKTLSAPLDSSTLFTNQFLPASTSTN